MTSAFARPLLCFAIALSLGGIAAAEAPSVTHLFPAGGQAGATVAVTAAGKLGDKPLSVWTSRDDVKVELLPEAGKLNISIAAEAKPGVCWIRFSNEEGATALKAFIVGALQEANETEPNEELTAPHKLDAPSLVINGVLDKGSDVDTFAVTLKAGETLVASQLAHRVLGSPMDAVLQLVSPAGFVIAQNDDDHGFDPQLVYQAESDGVYFVRTFAFPSDPNSTIRFSGHPTYVYRLTLTTGPFVDHVLPLAVTRDASPTVQAFGWNIPAEAATIAVEPEGEELVRITGGMPTALNVRVPIVQRASVVEQEPTDRATPQVVPFPVTVSGRIGEPGDVDAYRFPATMGQKLELKIESRAIGYPLDAVLKLIGPAGDVIQKVDDISNASFDTTLDYDVPKDGDYTIEISDLNRHGGLRYAYRLTIAEQSPDFDLRLAADAFVGKPGEPTEIPVTINRLRGFAGEIEVAAVGLPEGISVAPVKSINEGDAAKAVKLIVENKSGAAYSGLLRIVGRTVGDAPISRAVLAPIAGTTELTGDFWLTLPKPPEPAQPATAPN